MVDLVRSGERVTVVWGILMDVVSVPVLVDGATFYVEIADLSGVGTVGLDEVLSFDGVRDAVAAIASELRSAWDRARPQEAMVAFGLKLSVKQGRLTGLLVEGGGEASLTVTLTWKQPADEDRSG